MQVNKDNVQDEVWLGVGSEGISVCMKKVCSTYAARIASSNFVWRDIKKLCYTKQHFELTTLTNPTKYKFKMDSNKYEVFMFILHCLSIMLENIPNCEDNIVIEACLSSSVKIF